MTRRKGNGKRGGRGGGVQGDISDSRGRGWRGRGGGRGRGVPGSYLIDEALDFNIQMYADAHLETPPYGGGRGGHTRQSSQPNFEHNTPSRRGRGRGFLVRGRGHPEMNFRSRYSDVGIGGSFSHRGRGGKAKKLQLDAPLTKLLYQDRPLLRPIGFVPSVFNPILFDQDEALLKPGIEEVGDTEQSHVPTAARVLRVFSGGNININVMESDNDDFNDQEEEELEVIDFNDIGKLCEQTEKPKKPSPKKSSVEKPFIGGFTDTHSIPPSTSLLHGPQHDPIDIDTLTKRIDKNLCATERSQEADAIEPSSFYIDTQPTPIPAEVAPPSNLFPSDEFDDDIIVYVAPHPRKGVQISQLPTNGVPDTSSFTPYVRNASLAPAVASSSSITATIEQQPTQSQPHPRDEIPSISTFSFSFPTPEGKTLGRLSVPPVTIPRLAISWKRKKGVLSMKGRKHTRSSFRAYGAMREEAQLHDPKHCERRRGDSDLDWGDTDGDGEDEKVGDGVDDVDGVESPSGLMNGSGNWKDKGKGKAIQVEDRHGMEVDSDLDLNTMQQFVGGLLGEDAGRHVTMDDLRDEEQMRLEMENEQDAGEDSMNVDESESDGSSDNEDEDAEISQVFADEEAMLISETLEFENEERDDESEDEDEDQTPRTSFQQRLERLRKKATSNKGDEYDVSDDCDDYNDMLERHMLFTQMDSNARPYYDVLSEADDDFEYFNHKKSKKLRAAYLPEHLKIQWENDRLKKAAYKKDRAQARLEAAADPLSPKKGGKKGRKAMLAAARVDPTITVLPNRIIDMVSLVQQMRRFIDDEGRQSMALPPTDKHTRKDIHDLAAAFNMTSISKGSGDARYTTLTKTLTSGFDVNEAKVAKITRRNGLRFVKKGKTRGDLVVQDKKGKKARAGAQVLLPRHREGEEVGKAAPKINSSNLGFRMLAMMGWSEGDRIGVSGGIQDPLIAIIKNTKLGLGAAK